MSVADKLLQVNQVKQDIKQAIEDKGVDMTGVAFVGYAEKIDEIQTGGDEYFFYSKAYYTITNNSALFENAWEDMKEVDPTEITRISTSSTQYGTLQYPNGEDNGVIIPDSVTSIGSYAFNDWQANNQPLVIPNSVTSIDSSAFRHWQANNQPLVIPNSVTSIGSYAFSYWSANNHPLVIPDSVTSIGQGVFSGWRANNQPLVIPNSVTSIGSSAFNNWPANNQPLVIPNSVTSIDSYAFRYWSANNQPLVIPNSVTSIGSYAFSDWQTVPYIIVERETPPTLANADAFRAQNNAPIYVPDESVTAYKTATNWSALSSRIFSINDKP